MREGNTPACRDDFNQIARSPRDRNGFARSLLCAALGLGAACLSAAAPALAGPSGPAVPGFQIEDYASVVNPVKLSFDSSGALFAGRDNRGSGGGGDLDTVPISIVRVLPGSLRGGPLSGEDWGPASDDPDAVLVDKAGLYSPAGTTLVGLKRSSTFGGRIRGVLPAGTGLTPHVVADSTVFSDPGDMAFDPQGRIILTDGNPNFRNVVAIAPGQTAGRAVSETILFTLDAQVYPRDLAIGTTGSIFTSASNGSVYRFDGTPERGGLIEYATGLGGGNADAEIPLEFGPGDSVWGNDLYTVTGDGYLVRISDNDGQAVQTIIGSGFGTGVKDIEFGPASITSGGAAFPGSEAAAALYVSMFNDDKVIRIFVIPEPATAALLMLAAAGLRARSVRRRG